MSQSEILFAQAQTVIPGGVNSPVRAFKGVGGTPVFIKRAQGAYIYDEDDTQYIDYVGSWGPMILGHTHPEVVTAITNAAQNGVSYGAPTAIETTLAEKVRSIYPSMEKLRMVSSGTEATMSAIRLARGFTGRDKMIKFEGCYHGHADSLLVKAGSGALTLGEPTSPGVPSALAELTITLDYNNSEQVKQVFEEIGSEIACVIVEPIAGNMNCVPPSKEFLQTLRDVCDTSGAVLIFDEVMTGFRVALGGAQAHYDITPDMTTLGKIVGGGLPVGAFGGKAEIMDYLAPVGPVYQAGTLSGNPLAMAAGLKTLELISQDGFYDALSQKTETLLKGLQAAADANSIPFTINQVGSMFGLFFSDQKDIQNFSDVMQCNVERFNAFFHGMLQEGVYLAPSAFEAGFVSSAHSDADINATIEKANRVFAGLS